MGVTHLRRGGLLIYPTETAYALGCDATNAQAVRAIFRLKGRERGKPLPLIVTSRAMAERYARFTPLARRLAKQHWPGPLTIVASSRLTHTVSPPLSEGEREGVRAQDCMGSAGGWDILAPGVAARDGSVALRISSNLIARALSRALGRPIISTSANRSGQPPCYTVRSALRSLNLNFLPLFQRGSDPSRGALAKWERGWRVGGETLGVDRKTPNVEEPAPMLKSTQRRSNLADRAGMLVLNIGPLPRRKPSTIVDARGGHTVVLRRGSIVV